MNSELQENKGEPLGLKKFVLLGVMLILVVVILVVIVSVYLNREVAILREDNSSLQAQILSMNQDASDTRNVESEEPKNYQVADVTYTYNKATKKNTFQLTYVPNQYSTNTKIRAIAIMKSGRYPFTLSEDNGYFVGSVDLPIGEVQSFIVCQEDNNLITTTMIENKMGEDWGYMRASIAQVIYSQTIGGEPESNIITIDGTIDIIRELDPTDITDVKIVLKNNSGVLYTYQMTEDEMGVLNMGGRFSKNIHFEIEVGENSNYKIYEVFVTYINTFTGEEGTLGGKINADETDSAAFVS